MSDVQLPRPVVFTNKAQCRDCCRCVRVCPVKAIRMFQGQAAVVPERCLGCGTCVRECPQAAKSFRNDLERAMRLAAPGVTLAASVAPSFAGIFPQWQWRRLPSALRRLGFSYVGETAVGAYYVAQQTARQASQTGKPVICTACPAVVSFVERYRPDLVPNLAGVVSPMIAHARLIRGRLGADTRVIFIGPCIAKKAEADRPEHAGAVDVVLTFLELEQWLRREGISFSACEESDFDQSPPGDARLFALEGGCLRTAGLGRELLADDVFAASGFGEVCAALDGLVEEDTPRVLEALFCRQGCVNGPATPAGRCVISRRSDVLRYQAGAPMTTGEEPACDLHATFGADEEVERAVAEEEIRRFLEKTGKARLEDQLNCGACGYATCRDKAIAVIRGLAEPEMCLPRMRRLAEQRVDRIIETSPNGIVILDEQLRILHMNPAFRRFFLCSDAAGGQNISYLMDPEPFERLKAGQESLIEITSDYARYNLVCHQLMYRLDDEKQYVGIFVNITSTQSNQRKLDRLRAQTVLQARELLEHQIQMAENLAKFLGESTAKGEDLVEKLMLVAEGTAESETHPRGQWLRDLYTSK